MTSTTRSACFKPRHSAITLALTALAALAAANAQAAPATMLQEDLRYDVRADATYTTEETTRLLINDAQGVQMLAQIPLLYSESLQTVEVLEAYTTTKDGQRLDVTPDKILLQQDPASANAPMFSDQKRKVVVFPQVEIGSVLTLRYRKTQLKPNLPGVFSEREALLRVFDFKDARLTVSAPADMPLQFESQGMQGGEVKVSEGKKEWHWTLSNASAAILEPGMVSLEDISPYVSMSNLKSYDELAQAYRLGADPAAKVTPAIQQMADDITKDVNNKDKRAQAEAIYNWVSSKIRYVAIFMNNGGYVPHNAEAILQARYGDCKDHATLLEALLAAKGIKSSQVLIHAGNRYQQDKLASAASFNHAITYLPDEKLFLDSTAAFGRFGVLPDSDASKSALVVNLGTGQSALLPTPNLSSKTDRISVETQASINTEGGITGQENIQATGAYDLVQRAIYSTLPREQVPQVVSSILAQRAQNGSGNMTYGDPHELTKTFDIKISYTIPNRVQLPGPGAFPASVGIGSLVGIVSQTGLGALPARKFPFQCPSGHREEITRFALPANLKPSTLPKAVKVSSKFGSYAASYSKEGSALVVKRVLDLNFPSMVCASEDYAEVKKITDSIGSDLRAQVLFK